MSTKVLLIFLFFSYFLIQSFLFFLFSESQVSYFPIFLSDQAAGHPVTFGLVHATCSYSLPKRQAAKLPFFAPWVGYEN